jgi:hypothetical protein
VSRIRVLPINSLTPLPLSLIIPPALNTDH